MEIQELVNNFFGIGNETSAPIIITIFVFALGIIINYLINLSEKIIKRNSTRKLFYEMLKEISRTTLSQAEIFKNFTKKLNIEYEDTFILKRQNINHLSNLNKLNFDTIHDSFFTGVENYFVFRHDREEFNKVWSEISNLTYWENQYRNDLDKFIDKFNEYENKRNDLLDTFKKTHDSIMINLKQTGTNERIDEYLVKFLKIIQDYQTVPNATHHFKAQNHFVLPLRKLYKEYMDFSFSIILNNHLLEASFYYDSLEKLLKVNEDLFESYSSLYDRIGETMKNYLRKNYNS